MIPASIASAVTLLTKKGWSVDTESPSVGAKRSIGEPSKTFYVANMFTPQENNILFSYTVPVNHDASELGSLFLAALHMELHKHNIKLQWHLPGRIVCEWDKAYSNLGIIAYHRPERFVRDLDAIWKRSDELVCSIIEAFEDCCSKEIKAEDQQVFVSDLVDLCLHGTFPYKHHCDS